MSLLSLPNETISHILEIVAEGRPPGEMYMELSDLALVSRRMYTLATPVLYRHLPVALQEAEGDDDDDATWEEHPWTTILSRTLKEDTRNELSSNTRSIEVELYVETHTKTFFPHRFNLLGFLGRRLIQHLLKCCPRVEVLKIIGFPAEVAQEVIPALCNRKSKPSLNELVIKGDEEGHFSTALDLGQIYTSLMSLRALRTLQLLSPLAAGSGRGVHLPALRALTVHDDLNIALAGLNELTLNALTTLTIGLGRSKTVHDPLLEGLTSFPNLDSLEIIRLPSDGLRVLTTIMWHVAQCTKLRTLRLVHLPPITTRSSASMYDDVVDLSILPSTLRSLDLSKSGFTPEPIRAFFASHAAPGCIVRADTSNWDEDDHEFWRHMLEDIDESDLVANGCGGEVGGDGR